MAAKKKTVNLSQFVREHNNLSPAEIVTAGAKQGLKIKPGLIYNVRAEDKKRAANYGRGTKKVLATEGRPGRVSAAPSGIEAMLREIVRDEIRKYFTER